MDKLSEHDSEKDDNKFDGNVDEAVENGEISDLVGDY